MQADRSTLAQLATLAITVWALAACGGGDGPSVSYLGVSNVGYGRTLTVTVNGAGLDQPGLQLVVDGPCSNVNRVASALSYQANFTCFADGVGSVEAIVLGADGVELGRVHVNVPVPQVTFNVAQGSQAGSFVVELDPVAAPITALNFIRYVNSSFYTGTIFHRVLPARVVQGGQYGSDKVLKTALFDPIALESNNGLKNLRGTIAMARTSEPDSATAQFYINLIDNAGFDRVDDGQPGYAVFGRVVEGLDAVDKIGAVPVSTVSSDFPSLPIDDVVMTLVTQTR